MTVEEERDALVHLLRSLEWQGPINEGVASCPECGYDAPTKANHGHSWQCQLAQTLDYYEGKVPA